MTLPALLNIPRRLRLAESAACHQRQHIAALQAQLADARAAVAYWQQQTLDARIAAEAAKLDKAFYYDAFVNKCKEVRR